MASSCTRCGAKAGLLGILASDLATGAYACPSCIDADRARQRKLVELSRLVIVTTTPSVEGHRVREYLGIESVEFVIGTGVFSEVSSSIADFFGQRSSAFEKKLSHAKAVAMGSLKLVAAERGANAIVGVDLDYTEFSGNRIALIINGTLVVIEPSSSAMEL